MGQDDRGTRIYYNGRRASSEGQLAQERPESNESDGVRGKPVARSPVCNAAAHGRIDGLGDQPIAFQLAQSDSEHRRADPVDRTAQLGEAHGALQITEEHSGAVLRLS